MEQRIGSITPSVHAAGIDPAFIPGLTPPAEAEGAQEAVPEQAEAEEQAAQETPASAPEAAEPESVAEVPAEDESSAEEPSDASQDAEPDAAAEDGEEDREEPDFEVSDRRGSITADKVGVRFTLDEEEADFRWDEIGAVEIDTPRFGRRFTVTVYTGEQRWYEAEVEAPSRAKLKEWAAQLDTILDAHFEDDEAAAEAADEAAADESGEDVESIEAAESGEDAAETEAAEAEATDADTDTEESADADEAEADAEAKADAKGSLKKA